MGDLLRKCGRIIAYARTSAHARTLFVHARESIRACATLCTRAEVFAHKRTTANARKFLDLFCSDLGVL